MEAYKFVCPECGGDLVKVEEKGNSLAKVCPNKKCKYRLRLGYER